MQSQSQKQEMVVLETVPELQRFLLVPRQDQGMIGLVPTMGALHEGHLSLCRKALSECQQVVVSIFLNPLQFSADEDLEQYPSDRQRDLELLRTSGVKCVFMPTPNALGVGKNPRTKVLNSVLTADLLGHFRPQHFAGVCTIVATLFHIVQPQRAYFGKKDYQQLVILRQMVQDLFFPVEIVAGETVRDHDGVALSSRNAYLSVEGRLQAQAIPLALQEVSAAFNEGVCQVAALQKLSRRALEAAGLNVDYIALRRQNDLAELSGEINIAAVLLIAVRVGTVRLIDGIELINR